MQQICHAALRLRVGYTTAQTIKHWGSELQRSADYVFPEPSSDSKLLEIHSSRPYLQSLVPEAQGWRWEIQCLSNLTIHSRAEEMFQSKVSPFPKSPSQIRIPVQWIHLKSVLGTPFISQILLPPVSINIPLHRGDITPVKPVQFTTGVTSALLCAI